DNAGSKNADGIDQRRAPDVRPVLHSMADSAASRTSRSARPASTKRRPDAVSADTENKLARAAQSAQRLAQLSDVARDDGTLDLFAGDASRAALEALNIDTRQGTLAGFELPGDALAAVVGAPSAASAEPDAGPAPALAEAEAAQRNARGARSGEVAAGSTETAASSLSAAASSAVSD